MNDFLTVLLDTNSCGVTRRMSVHRADNSCDRRLLVVTGRRVSYIGSKEYDRFIEHLERMDYPTEENTIQRQTHYLRANGRNKDTVDTAKLNIDLQT